MKSMFSSLSPESKLVERATKDDETPTAGYLYNEMCKTTNESVTQCQALQDFLLKRLGKDSPQVKFKVLRCLKHLLLKGNPSFRRDMQRRHDLLRECLNFRGPPDPYRGDVPFKNVREEAQEVMTILFSEGESTMSRDTLQGGSSGSVGGTGLSGGGGGGGGGSSGGGAYASSYGQANTSDSYSSSSDAHRGPTSQSSMTGMGNYYPEKKEEKNVGGMIKGASSWVANKVSSGVNQIMEPSGGPPQPNYKSSLSNFGGVTGDANAASSSYYNSNISYDVRGSDASATDKPRIRGQPGGSWGQVSSSQSSTRSTGGGGPAPKSAVGESAAVSPSGPASEVEIKAVDDVCAQGGVRPVPPRDVLAQFVTRCKTLRIVIVLDLLDEKLEAQAWQVRLKALYVLEALIKANTEGVVEHCDGSESLEQCSSSSQKSVREKATKVLKLVDTRLGRNDEVTEEPEPPAYSGPRVNKGGSGSGSGVKVDNLIDAGASSSPPDEKKTAEARALFAGLNFADGDDAPSPAATAVESTPTTTTDSGGGGGGGGGGGSLFAGLDFSSAPPSPTTGATVATTTAATKSSSAPSSTLAQDSLLLGLLDDEPTPAASPIPSSEDRDNSSGNVNGSGGGGGGGNDADPSASALEDLLSIDLSPQQSIVRGTAMVARAPTKKYATTIKTYPSPQPSQPGATTPGRLSNPPLFTAVRPRPAPSSAPLTAPTAAIPKTRTDGAKGSAGNSGASFSFMSGANQSAFSFVQDELDKNAK